MLNKKWYKSKTLWVNTIAILGILFQTSTGLKLIPLETQGAILAILNIIMRATVTNSNITT